MGPRSEVNSSFTEEWAGPGSEVWEPGPGGSGGPGGRPRSRGPTGP